MANAYDVIRSRVRGFMTHDKQNRIIRAATGQTASTLPNTTYDVLQSYGYDIIADYLRLEQDLTSRFVDYEGMDEYPETSAVLNIYADDATQPDTPTNKRVWVTSKDKDVEMILMDLLHRTLRIEEELWSLCRSLCKYGNDYEEIIVAEDGVIGLNHLPAHTVRRVEGVRGELYGFVQDFQGRSGYTPREFQALIAQRNMGASQTGNMMPGQGFGPPITGDLDDAVAFENWQVAHFRMRLKQRKALYGYSVLEPARWIWKRLMLLEDSALIYRLQRAAERYIYYVNTGDNPPNEAFRLVNMVRHQHKKKKFINPTTNEIDLKYTLIAPQDDLFIPAPGGDPSTRVEILGSPNWQRMEDLEYFMRKMFSAMLVPRAYLSQEEGINRAVLSQEDVRFARTIMRVQRELKLGLEHICRVHLAALGIPAHMVEFEVHFTVPSSIFELAQIEVKNARADLAARTLEHTSLRYVLENIYGLSDEDIEVVFKQRGDEAELQGDFLGRQNKAATKYERQMAAGGGLGGGGGGGSRGAGNRGLFAQTSHDIERQLMELRLPDGIDDRGYSTSMVPSRVHLQRMLPGNPVRRDIWKTLQEEKQNKADKAKLDAKMDALLRSNSAMNRRISDMRGLLQDIRAVQGRQR